MELQQDAEATRHLIAEGQRRADEAHAVSGAATSAALAHALKAIEAARHKEAKQERQRYEAVQAAELATEATRLATTKALVEAREQEHRMAVHSARSLKAEQD